jgi:hypothetical protein
MLENTKKTLPAAATQRKERHRGKGGSHYLF